MFFKRTPKTENYARAISLYMSDSEGKIIIAPFHRHTDGIYYEQDICTVLDLSVDDALLAETIQQSLALFSVKYTNLSEMKLTDWAAFKYSKLKTVKSFEKLYHRIHIKGANEANIILVISGDLSSDADLNLSTSASAHEKNEKLGALVRKVYTACITK